MLQQKRFPIVAAHLNFPCFFHFLINLSSYHIFYANGDQKKARVVIIISDKIDFKIKAVKRDKEVTLHNDQRINPRRYNNINIYAPNIGARQYVRQMLMSMKEEINSNTIIVGDFNTPLTTMNRSTKEKINMETQTLNDTMDQLDLIDIFLKSLIILRTFFCL